MASDHKGAWLSTATVLFFTWALLTLLVRLWVKLRHRETWQFDDSSISLAFVFALSHVVVTIAAVNAGYGGPEENEQGRIAKLLYAAQLLYIITVGISKVSTAFFIARLTRYGPQIRQAHLLAMISGLWALASVIAVAARGSVAAPWNVMDGSKALFIRWIVVEVFGLVIEAGLFALEVNLVWGLNMSTKKRLTILSAFACRLVLTPIIIARLYYLAPQTQQTHDSANIAAQIITEAALQFALISASVTCLKPFLRPFHSGGYLVDSVGAPGSGLRTNGRSSSRDPYYKLSAVKKAGKDGTLVTITQREIDEEWPGLRGDGGTQWATAGGGEEVEEPYPHVPARRSGGPMVIEETKTFVVSQTQVQP